MGIVLVEESVLFQAGKDGVFAHAHIVCPFLKGDNFSPGCGLMGSPAHRRYLPLLLDPPVILEWAKPDAIRENAGI